LAGAFLAGAVLNDFFVVFVAIDSFAFTAEMVGFYALRCKGAVEGKNSFIAASDNRWGCKGGFKLHTSADISYTSWKVFAPLPMGTIGPSNERYYVRTD
jgi:hypothetical protein